MATLGELKVDIGADTSGLDKAKAYSEKQMRAISDNLQRGFGDMAGKLAVMLGSVFAVERIVHFTMAISESAGEIARLAPALGMTTQKLSVLKYAAQLSGVGLEQLSQGLGKVVTGMRDAAEGGAGDVARALGAMGISATDSAGRLRPLPAVLDDIIKKFGEYRDDSNKTALAIALFGESGAKMVPLLSRGAAGMKEIEDQAKSLGIVLDETSAKQAQKFNEDVRRMTASFEGLAMVVFKEVVPKITSVVNAISDYIAKGELWKDVNSALEVGMKSIASTAFVIVNTLMASGKAVTTLAEATWKLVTLDFKGATQVFEEGWDKVGETVRQYKPILDQIWDQKAAQGWNATVTYAADNASKSMATAADATASSWVTAVSSVNAANAQIIDAVTTTTQTIAENTQKAAAPAIVAAELYNRAQAEGFQLTQQMLNANEQLAKSQDRLNQLFYWGKIDLQTYQRAMAENSLWGRKNMNDLASAVSTALTTIFRNNKAAAIAAAVINTAQGITKNLAEYPQPLAAIMAGITAASGAAQIAAIRSASSSGAGSVPSVSSSGGAADAAVAQSTAPTAANGTLTVKGIDPSGLFTGDAVRSLAERLLDYQRDGGKVVLV